MRAAGRTCVSFAYFSQIREPRLVVTAHLHAPEVDVVAIGADDVLALSQRLVRDPVDRDADRADRTPARAESLTDLVGLGRPEGLAEGLQEFHLVETVVAAHEGEDDVPVRHDGHRLRGGTRIDAQKLRDGLD